MAKQQLLNYQRARLMAIRNDTEMVLFTSVVTTEIVARIAGDYEMRIDEHLPVFWLTEEDRARSVGSEDWDTAVQRFGFGLVAISFADWTEGRVLDSLRTTFPTIRLSEALSPHF